jgi:hypothetical protein
VYGSCKLKCSSPRGCDARDAPLEEGGGRVVRKDPDSPYLTPSSSLFFALFRPYFVKSIRSDY